MGIVLSMIMSTSEAHQQNLEKEINAAVKDNSERSYVQLCDVDERRVKMASDTCSNVLDLSIIEQNKMLNMLVS